MRYHLALIPCFCALFACTSRPEVPQACEQRQAEVILVQFPDVKHSVDRKAVEWKFGELGKYINEMSYGKVCLSSRVTARWYTMPRPIASYRLAQQNLKVRKPQVDRLLRDVLDAAGGEVDFSKARYVFFFLGADREEYGMTCLYLYPGIFSWRATKTLKTGEGADFNGEIAVFHSGAHLGNLIHDTLHEFGGLKGDRRGVPCLYDQNLQAAEGNFRKVFLKSLVFMGFWDPMSCHHHVGMSAWTRLRLGWLDEKKVRVLRPGETAEVLLGPLGDGASPVLAIKIQLSPDTYYLVENRQPVGYDRYLQDSGVLVSFADETVAECLDGKAPVRLVNAEPGIPMLGGAAFDLGGRSAFTDASNNVKITLLEKAGGSYRVKISPVQETP
ncbi:MAG: hypothetical protein NDI60_04545 [Elusimicrobiales bacterium]|nr:hypothetical protein [Elusimicrobiales bacterium]